MPLSSYSSYHPSALVKPVKLTGVRPNPSVMENIAAMVSLIDAISMGKVRFTVPTDATTTYVFYAAI